MIYCSPLNDLNHVSIMNHIIREKQQIICHLLWTRWAFVMQHTRVDGDLRVSPMSTLDLILLLKEKILSKIHSNKGPGLRKVSFDGFILAVLPAKVMEVLRKFLKRQHEFITKHLQAALTSDTFPPFLG